MSESKEKKKTTVFIEPDLLRKVKVKSASDDLKFQQLVNDLLREWVEAPADGASPLMRQMLSEQPTDAEMELFRRFLRLWTKPKGVMEPHIRDLVAKAIGVEPPK